VSERRHGQLVAIDCEVNKCRGPPFANAESAIAIVRPQTTSGLEPPSEEAPQNRTVGYCHKYRAARTKSSPNEAALVASIQFGNRTIGLISISRMFSEPTPRLSHFDQEKPVLGIRRRARLLKTAHRISLIIFCGAHCFPVRVGLKGNTMRPIQFRKLGQQARN
jgi:hypothetical protein